MNEHDLKCPYCGEPFTQNDIRDELVPTHNFPRPCRAVCPGSQQHPRSVEDKRPLWKDDPTKGIEQVNNAIDGPPSGDCITFWSIFERPLDYPENFVVRRFFVPGGSLQPLVERTPVAVCDSLEEARSAISAPVCRMPVTEKDVRSLIETYMQL